MKLTEEEKKPFLIDYTEDNGISWKEGTVIEVKGGMFGTVKLKDDKTSEEKEVFASQTKMRVRIS